MNCNESHISYDHFSFDNIPDNSEPFFSPHTPMPSNINHYTGSSINSPDCPVMPLPIQENAENTQYRSQISPKINLINLSSIPNPHQDELLLESVDHIVSNILSQVKELYFLYLFEEIESLLTQRFPQFLENNLPNVVYVLKKMKLFYLLLIDKKYDAKIYYDDCFIHILKKSRTHTQQKEKFFTRLLSNPNILRRKNFFEKNFDKFILELGRALYAYLLLKIRNESELCEDYFERNNIEIKNNQGASRKTSEGSSNGGMIDLEGMEKIETIWENNNNKNNDSQMPIDIISNLNNRESDFCENQAEEIQDLSQFSTQEEFSDFEDEIERSSEQCQDSNVMAISQVAINPEFVDFINSQNCPIQLISNLERNNCANPLPSSSCIKSNTYHYTDSVDQYYFDPSSNFNLITKIQLPRPKILRGDHKLPALKSFKPKYTKRENIDKKIIRKFKLYLKNLQKLKRLNLRNRNFDEHFWWMFINGDLFPPLNFFDNKTQMNVEFKSLNSKYLMWFFSKSESKTLYTEFVNDIGKNFVMELAIDYKIENSEELQQLESYVNNFQNNFDITCTFIDQKNLDREERSFDSNDGNIFDLNFSSQEVLQKKCERRKFERSREYEMNSLDLDGSKMRSEKENCESSESEE